MRLLLMLVALGGLTAAHGATWYVDAANYGKEGLDGSSENAYGTIQQAIDAATTQHGDTIMVRPGVYDKGVVTTDKGAPYPCRVLVTKNLRIISTDGRDKTHIVGVRDARDVKNGIGPDSVACVVFKSNLPAFSAECDDRVVLDGFTIRDGTRDTPYDKGGYGAALAQTTWEPGNSLYYHVVDCVISNCAANGRVSCSVTLHRCLVTGNTSPSVDGAGTGISDGYAENTLFVANKGSMDIRGAEIINCTVAGQVTTRAISGTAPIKNSIIAMNASDRSSNVHSNLANSVVSTYGNSPVENYFPIAVNSALGVAATNIYFAPAFADFRVVSDSPAIGRADPRLLTRIPVPQGYTYKSYDGVAIDVESDTPIQAGACQQVADRSNAGLAYFTVQTEDKTNISVAVVNDHPILSEKLDFAYVNANSGQLKFGARYSDVPLSCVRNPLAYTTNSDGSIKNYIDFRFSSYGSPVYLPSPAAGQVLTYAMSFVRQYYYVDPVNGNDEWDGTCDKTGIDAAANKGPWRTLQHVASNATLFNRNPRAMIYCAAGTYAEGSNNHARVNFPEAWRRLHFVSADGIGKAVIVGAPDPDTEDGIGENALSCIRCGTPACGLGFVGFTLTGGYSRVRGLNYGQSFGSAAYASVSLTLTDCVITNNFAQQNPLYGCSIYRSVVADNKVLLGWPLIGACRLAGCIIRDNNVGSGSGWSTDNSIFVNCQLERTRTRVSGSDLSGQGWFYNCLMLNLDAIQRVSESRGCVFDNCGGNMKENKGSGDYTLDIVPGYSGDACLANKKAGDYHPTTSSPVWTAAIHDAEKQRIWQNTDFEGKPVLDDNGQVIGAGAYLTATEKALFVHDNDEGWLVVSGREDGDNTVGTGVTIAPNAASKRPVAGWSVGGTNYYFGATGSKTFTEADVLAAGGCLDITPVLSNEWFVNPNADPEAGIVGSDDNHGFSRYFPKKTLAGAMANVISNDTVWAARGRYDEKTMNPSKYPTPARVDIPQFVSLKSEEDDPETTFIVGAAGPGENGTGEGATRCVLLRKGALIRGFTCTGGRMFDNTQDTTTRDSAPGLCSYGYDSRDVYSENCIVSNCVAQNFVILSGTHRGLRVYENTTLNRGIGYSAKFYNCLFDRNVIKDGNSAFSYSHFANMTFGDNNVRLSDRTRFSVNFDGSAGSAVNSLICTWGSGSVAVTNCVFVHGSLRDNFVNSQAFGSINDVKLDEGYVPRLDSPLVDAGIMNCASVDDTTDVWGNQRVSNGRIDIGACEADWRPVYAADIRQSRIEVVSATPSVVETANKTVALGVDGQGGALAVNCLTTSSTAPLVLMLRVTGNGVLTVKSGDVLLGEYRASADPIKLALTLDTREVSFAYEPGADDVGTAEILRAALEQGTIITFK